MANAVALHMVTLTPTLTTMIKLIMIVAATTTHIAPMTITNMNTMSMNTIMARLRLRNPLYGGWLCWASLT